AVLRNSNFYLKEGITYSASGSKGASYRLLPVNSIFDTGGSCIFAEKKYKNLYYLLAFLNSSLNSYIINCLNPTVNTQVGDIQRVPFAIPNQIFEKIITTLSEKNIRNKSKILSHFI